MLRPKETPGARATCPAVLQAALPAEILPTLQGLGSPPPRSTLPVSAGVGTLGEALKAPRHQGSGVPSARARWLSCAMGSRRSRAIKQPKKKELLDTTFDCPFCGASKAVEVRQDGGDCTFLGDGRHLDGVWGLVHLPRLWKTLGRGPGTSAPSKGMEDTLTGSGD